MSKHLDGIKPTSKEAREEAKSRAETKKIKVNVSNFNKNVSNVTLTLWKATAAVAATIMAGKLIECAPQGICTFKGRTLTVGMVLAAVLVIEIYIQVAKRLWEVHKR